jgi:phage regulator Rha-like protein
MTDLSVSDLVQKGRDDEPVTTTAIIAFETRNEHASVIALVRKYQKDLEEFGRVRFEIEPFATNGGTQHREIAILNEQQSTLLLTYMRNSDIVRAFKKRLVKAFYEMRRLLIEQSRQVFALPPDLIEQQRRTDLALAMLADCQRQFHGETMGRFDTIESRLDVLEEHAKATSKRRAFGAPVLREWNAVLVMRYGGQCPCCQNVRIVDAFGRPIEGVYEADHWRSPGHNKVGDGWPVCASCNRETLERERLSKQYAFQHFHDLRKGLFRADEESALQMTLDALLGVAA